MNQMVKQLWKVPVLGTTRIKTIPITYNDVTKGNTTRRYIYSGFDWDLVAECKAIAGGKWDPEKKCWHFPLNERNEYHFKVLTGWNDDHYRSDTWKGYESLIHYIFPELYPWQCQGIGFCLAKLRVMLAFTMGLGKTLTCLRLIEIVQGHHNAAVKGIDLPFDSASVWWLVAPKATLRSWEFEIKKWKSPIDFQVVTTYESLRKHLNNDCPNGVIIDECIKIKNHAAQRSQITSELCRNIRNNGGYILGLSGLPSPKIVTDWWHQVECLRPGFIREGNPHKMRDRYADIKWEDGPYGKFPKDIVWKPDEVRRLGKRLKDIVIVKDKKDCLDLPAKVYDQIELEVDRDTEYLAKYIVNNSETAIQALISLRTLSDGFQYENKEPTWLGSPKMAIIGELLEQYAQENEGCGRLVIYAAFRGSIDKLMEWPITTCNQVPPIPWNFYSIDGRGMDKNVLEIFDKSNHNICIVAYPGCIHGLNLQRTEALVYYSNDFSSDYRSQSEDRRDRPGMDTTKGTRVIDLFHLPIDRLIYEGITGQLDLHSLTLQEIKKYV